MLRVVSVSLGSSARDKTGRASFLGETVELTRVGTDGNYSRALRIIAELDGTVDAIGLGGIDLYLWAGTRRYVIRDAARLAAQAKTTPVVDGSTLKLLLEPRMVDQLAESSRTSNVEDPNSMETRLSSAQRQTGEPMGEPTDQTASLPPLKGSKALLVSAVDRWGMAEALARQTGSVIFGDALYALGLPWPLRSLAQVRRLAGFIAPVISQLPFQLLYPTGDKQQQHKPHYSEYFTWADWICGDYHYISRNLPPRLDGKVVLTNTTTAADQQRLRALGLSWLVTTTPVIDGRSFGMNVLEAVIAALIRRADDTLTRENYEVYLNKLDLKPSVMRLN